MDSQILEATRRCESNMDLTGNFFLVRFTDEGASLLASVWKLTFVNNLFQPSRFWYGNSRLNMHEGLHLIFFGCGKYGHRLDQCSLGQPKVMQPSPILATHSDEALQKEVAPATASTGSSVDSNLNLVDNQ
ncbi:hypothetical protein PIB30_024824 [Stylosanthes scabra]|uniref:Uncharacterized protein n=1 Tax=Stylosanthes scabra TaxID=79078 RepID=A0ABU6Y716_9FABA|nr:hypothetical protein [Stylosanthes scabra]